MKFYKLKWLIYFFLYKLNRWLGGKTKWEYSDERYYPPFPPSHFNCRCVVYPSVLEEWHWFNSLS